MARSRKSAPEPVEESGPQKAGMGVEDGIVVTTTLLLVVACVAVWLRYSSFYGG